MHGVHRVGSRRAWLSARAIASVIAASIAIGGSAQEPPALDASSIEGLRIGTIEIVSRDVFSVEEGAVGGLYSVANALHIRTREKIIRKFLLFREGDPYNPSRLEESGRNLRALSYLQTASVELAGPPHDGVVDVRVVTQDSWSFEPGGNAGSAGGETQTSLELTEGNFLGLGKELSVHFENGVDRSGTGIRYRDPAMFGRYWNGEMAYWDNSDGSELSLKVNRPFFAFAAPWSVGGLVDDRLYAQKLYANAEVANEFDQQHEQMTLGYGFAIRPNDHHANRLTLGLDFVADDFTESTEGLTTSLPANREFRYLFVNYEYALNEFVRMNFVNRDLRYEDFRIGTLLRLKAGISPEAFGVDQSTGLLAAEVSQGHMFGPQTMLLARATWSSRINAARTNEMMRGDLRLVRRFDTRYPHTTIVRIAAEHGSDLDEEVQVFADGETGLRGYNLHAFSGDSSLHLNIEHRWNLGRELWHLVSPGAAVFVDAGNAANGSAAFDPGNLKFDAGVGIRLGVVRTPRNILRVDFAYAFDPDPLGNEGWLVSFSGSHAF